MRFDKFNFHDILKQNLTKRSFFRTTDIQFKCIKPVLNDEDVLAIAQTGSGKTAAFVIPIIEKIIRWQSNSAENDRLYSIVLVPTRELAQQIGKLCADFTEDLNIKSLSIIGGVEQDPQINSLLAGVNVLIATPGRMFDLIHQRYIDLSSVKILVLDEADRMLDAGFLNDIVSIKRKLRHEHQTLFFSATIDSKIKKLAYSQIRSDALRIQISPENTINKNIEHYISFVNMDDKRHVLTNLIKSTNGEQFIVFVRTQVRAERVMKHLEKNQILCSDFHGGLDQNAREKNLQCFKNKETQILIATDLSARGIDIEAVPYVINYDLPDIAENYIHRIGRTGRGFNLGKAISFCAPEEKQKLKDIEEFIQMSIPVQQISEQYVLQNAIKTTEEASLEDILQMEEDAFGINKKKRKNK